MNINSDNPYSDPIEIQNALSKMSAKALEYVKQTDQSDATQVDDQTATFNRDNLHDTAQKFVESGLSVFPIQINKKPAIRTWQSYQKHLPTAADLDQMFNGKLKNKGAVISGIAIIGGAVSGGLECLDFDDKGSAFDAWKAKIPLALYSRLTVERSPSGGFHAYYRCSTVGDKTVFYKNVDGEKKTLIEVRGNGHYTICDPSTGYKLLQGDFLSIPQLTEAERQTLIDAARSFDQTPPPTQKPKNSKTPIDNRVAPRVVASDSRPGDDYTKKATMEEVESLLVDNGWTVESRDADRIHFTRPGKDPRQGESGNLKLIDGIPLFYNHSSNAPDVPVDKGLTPYQLLTHLEFNDDWKEAARFLSSKGYGENRNASNIVANSTPEAPSDDTAIELDRSRDTWTDFPIDCLPPRTRSYVETAAKGLNSDQAYVAMSLLATVSGTIGARLKVHQLPGVNWRVAPIIWVAQVGSSSAKKSPALKNSGRNFLENKKRKFRERYREEMQAYGNAVKKRNIVMTRINELESLLIQATILDGSDEITIPGTKGRKSETISVEEAQKRLEKWKQSEIYLNEPEMPNERIIEISGAFSLPGLVDTASKNPMGFLVFQEELTQLFKSIEDNSQINASGELLNFFDGGESRTALKEKERNRYASSCWASILGALVPDNLKRYIGGTERQTDGFLSRFLLVFPPPVPNYDPKRKLDDTSVEYNEMKEIFEAIADYTGEIKTTDNGNRIEISRLTTLSDEALNAFYEERQKLHDQAYASKTEIERSLFGKAESYLIRFALLLFILESVERFRFDISANMPDGLETYTETTQISLDTFRRAKQLTEWAVDETRQVYRLSGFIADDPLLNKIVASIRNAGKPLTSNDIGLKINQLKGKDNKDERDRLLNIAVKEKILNAEEHRNDQNGTVSIFYSLPE